MIKKMEAHAGKKWDVVIIGGGATGLGCAVDAASRGYKTLLVEKFDFAKSTSSKSTKLVHGGVRYLQQGNIKLVREALRERGILLKNAPHLVGNLTFNIPAYSLWQKIYYYTGLFLYDMLAGYLSLGPSRWLSASHIKTSLGNIKENGLKGGISYHDGQFDDSRLAINLMQTAVQAGATAINYMSAKGFTKDERKKIQGVHLRDEVTGMEYDVLAKVVINATGVFADDIMQMDEPEKKQSIIPSQGAHVVVDKKFLPGKEGLMIPKTRDGRVLFVIPWHGRCVMGTTDIQVKEISADPIPLEEEIDFILETAREYMHYAPGREDILSVFAGLRPLAAPTGNKKNTREISRGHKVFVSSSGLVNITGGKWTTYRKMAEDTVDLAAREGRLIQSPCKTENLPVHGFNWQPAIPDALFFYGSDAVMIRKLQQTDAHLKTTIHPDLPYTWAEVQWVVEHEMCVTLEDVLARRTRAILLNAQAAVESSVQVAHFMADILQKDNSWIEDQVRKFNTFAQGYIPLAWKL